MCRHCSIRSIMWVCYRIRSPDRAGLSGGGNSAAEEQVRGEIDHEDQEQESDGEVRGSGAEGAMKERISYGEVEILIGSDEAGSDQDW